MSEWNINNKLFNDPKAAGEKLIANYEKLTPEHKKWVKEYLKSINADIAHHYTDLARFFEKKFNERHEVMKENGWIDYD